MTAFTEDVAQYQIPPILHDPGKLIERSRPVVENGKDALTKEEIEGTVTKGDRFRPALDEPGRFKPGGSFAEERCRMVESYQAVVTGPFQVLQGPPRTAADIGDKGTTREIADLQRPVGERRTSRPYARPHDATDLRPVECHHERYFYPKNGNSSTQRRRGAEKIETLANRLT
jgi:hypothetical protein